MELINIPPVTALAVVFVVAFLLYQIALRFLLALNRRSTAREKGCLPAPVFPLWDKLLGTDLFRANVTAIKGHRFLDANTNQFRMMGTNTFLMYALGKSTYITIEPENLKAIQSVDFKKWGFPTRRKMGFRQLLGDGNQSSWFRIAGENLMANKQPGIFTTDGRQWQHSRDMLRPSFTRSQVGDLPTFERHIRHLVAAIPRDGSTVDLSELFFRLTIDSATEFLFGESTESLSRGSSEGFAKMFTRAQSHIITLARFGGWGHLFLSRSQFKQDRKFVFDFVDHYVEVALARRGQLLAANAEKPTGRYIFMDELVRQTTDRLQIRSELLNILLAGRDTTGELRTSSKTTASENKY